MEHSYYTKAYRIVGIILIIALCVAILPINAISAYITSEQIEADEGQVVSDSEDSLAGIMSEEEQIPKLSLEDIIGEDISLRDEITKHFRIADGSKIAVQYDTIIHYEDEEGKLQDIDNSLRLQASDGDILQAEITAGESVISSVMDKLDISKQVIDDQEVLDSLISQKTDLTRQEDGRQAEITNQTTQDTNAEVSTDIETHSDAGLSVSRDTNSEASTDLTVSPDARTDNTEELENAVSPGVTNGEDTVKVNTEDERAASDSSDIKADKIIIAEADGKNLGYKLSDSDLAKLSDAELSSKDNKILDTKFAVVSGIGQELTASHDKYSVGFSMIGANLRAATVLEDKIEDEKSVASAFVLPNISSTVKYANVLDGVDLQYTTAGELTKETIVVNSPQESYSYSFELTLTNLRPVENKDKSISLVDKDTGAEIYVIPAPYMFDAADEVSYDVEYTLTQKGETYILTVTADAKWINDENRAFPVSIDPTIAIIKEGISTNNQIIMTYVCSGSPSTPRADYTSMYVGYDSGSTKINRTLMKIPTLPVLPNNSVVVNASYYMAQMGGTYNGINQGYSHIGCSSIKVGAHAITANSTAFASSTWNNQPAHSTELVDYTTVSASTNYTYMSWDLTRIVKGWYSGATQNYGVKFIATNEASMHNTYCAKVAFFNNVNMPRLAVQYRNNVGLEDYYTYQSQTIGQAGNAFVSDYSSQLTIVKDDFTNVGVTSFSLCHVYNSAYSEGNFYEVTAHSAYGSGMKLGFGWKLSAQQSVKEVQLVDVNNTYKTYLVYIDADGTEHYFSQSSNNSSIYNDEDGLNLKIEKQGTTNYKLTDEKNNYIEFVKGVVTVIGDSNGNKIYFIYNNINASITTPSAWQPTGSNDKLVAIRQYNDGESGYATLATLAYDAQNYLTSITDQAGRVTSYSYSSTSANRRLTTITHADGTTASYAYNASGSNKLTSITDNKLKYKIDYTYASDGRVNSVKEYGNGTLGSTMNITPNTDGITTYRENGVGKAINTSYDILSHYIFDFVGRTINVYSTDSAGEMILGAGTSKYTNNSGTSAMNNRIETASTIGVSSVNLLKEGGMETSYEWGMYNTNGSSAIGTASSTANARTGERAQQVKLTSAFTGTVKCSQTSVSLTAGKTYTLSAYVNTSAVTSFTGKGIYLEALRGSAVYTGDATTIKTSDTSADGWRRIVLAFTPTTSGTYTISVCYNKFVGTAYADDIQLEAGDKVGSYNMLENGGFEETRSWVTASTNYNTTQKRSGTRSLALTGPIDGVTSTEQTVKVNLSGNKTYVLSGWAKAVSVPTYGYPRAFRLLAVVTYSNGTTESHDKDFCADTTQWQYLSMPIVPKEPTRTVSTITVYLRYDNNANIAYFDNISLSREVAQTYKYNSTGKLVSVSATESPAVTYTYSGADLMKVTSPAEGAYDYTYDSAKNVTSIKNGTITTSMTYDAKGNTTSSTLSGTSGRTMNSSATYTSYGNLIATATASNGSTTTYTYSNPINIATGQALTIADAKGNTTNYNYAANNGRLDMMFMSGKISVDYTYANGMLTQIARGGYLPTGGSKLTQSYTFGRNNFGQITNVKIGDSSAARTMATYTFMSNNGPVTKMTYGNNQYVNYLYDNFGRTTQEGYSNGLSYNYLYRGDGSIYQVRSTNGNEINTYDYDSIGRIAFRELAHSGIGLNQVTRYSYTNKNQPYGIGIIANSNTGGLIDTYETYTYNAYGDVSVKQMFSGQLVNYGYDSLNRLSSRSVSGTNFTTAYTYMNGAGSNTTTPLIASMSYKNGASVLNQFNYAYDALGNITGVSDLASSTTTYYDYDTQNQVTRERAGSRTYDYEYDTYGNIRSVSGSATKTFTYGNAVWRDLLTAYNGNTITYDNIGNPTSYYNGATMTWIHGNQLSKYSTTGNTINYTYNADGIRIRKQVNSTNYDYVVDGMRIVGEYSPNSIKIFSYDKNGHPFSMTYNGALYYYTTNLQGDVIQMRNSSGSVVASYTYNAWGEIISSSGNMAQINPLRYRGYYYDSETGFYYLNSRYYDPAICRFINADSLMGTSPDMLSYNLFAYCNNNPVNFSDPTGKAPKKTGLFWTDPITKTTWEYGPNEMYAAQADIPPQAFLYWKKHGGSAPSINQTVNTSKGIRTITGVAYYTPSQKYHEADRLSYMAQINIVDFVIFLAEGLGAVGLAVIANPVAALTIVVAGSANFMGAAGASDASHRFNAVKYEEGKGVLMVEWEYYNDRVGLVTQRDYYAWDGTSPIPGLG